MTDDLFPDGMPLADAREILRSLVDDGHRCPCCTQFAKVYRRKLHATMARDLIRVYRTQGHRWFHLPTVHGKHPGDFAKLAHWGLIEEEPLRHPTDGSRAGWWRVTFPGATFVNGWSRVPKYARIYDGRCLNLTGDPVGIRDCLGDRFNYDELMAA